MNELDIDRNAEWGKTVSKMRGLFPKWQVTLEQLDTWKKRFGMLNQAWFREALELVYTNTKTENPKPEHASQAFREVKAGHQGIPLDESIAANRSMELMKSKWEQNDADAMRDRSRAWQEVRDWNDDDRIIWGTRFKDQFNFMAETNDVKNFETWSKTFSQQVKVFRNMIEEGSMALRYETEVQHGD